MSQRRPTADWQQDTGSVSLWCPWPLPHESRWPPCFITVCVLTRLIQRLEGSNGEWGKIFFFLNLLPLIMEENSFPIVLFPYVLLADATLITWLFLATKEFGNINTWGFGRRQAREKDFEWKCWVGNFQCLPCCHKVPGNKNGYDWTKTRESWEWHKVYLVPKKKKFL